MLTMEQQTKLCANPLSRFEYRQDQRPSNIENIAKQISKCRIPLSRFEL